MKRLGVIVLSILVLYAGVASALEKCWDREGHADHLASETHHRSHSSLGHSHASDDSSALIHCFSFANRLALVTETTTTRLPRLVEWVSFDRSHSILPVLMGLSGPRSLVSLSRILVFSFHTRVSHHLYLSVLHI